MVTLSGFEPENVAVKGQCVNQFHHSANMEQATRIELVSQPWQGRIITIILCLHMEQIKGIEPLSTAWKAEVLPLNYICMVPLVGIEPTTY